MQNDIVFVCLKIFHLSEKGSLLILTHPNFSPDLGALNNPLVYRAAPISQQSARLPFSIPGICSDRCACAVQSRFQGVHLHYRQFYLFDHFYTAFMPLHLRQFTVQNNRTEEGEGTEWGKENKL